MSASIVLSAVRLLVAGALKLLRREPQIIVLIYYAGKEQQ